MSKIVKVLTLIGAGYFGLKLLDKAAKVQNAVYGLEFIPVGARKFHFEGSMLAGKIDLLVKNASAERFVFKLVKSRLFFEGKLLAETPVNNAKITIEPNSQMVLADIAIRMALANVLYNLHHILAGKNMTADITIDVAGVVVNVPYDFNINDFK